MTAAELLAIARKGRPEVRYAVTRNGNFVGAFDATLGRFVAVAGLLLDGKWASMPMELLVNGKPLYTAEDWMENPCNCGSDECAATPGHCGAYRV